MRGKHIVCELNEQCIIGPVEDCVPTNVEMIDHNDSSLQSVKDKRLSYL